LVVLQAKIAFVGDGTVGKTSLINSFTDKTSFMESYLMTIGLNIVVHKIEKENDIKINFAIWDLGGQPRFTVVRPQFYKGAQQIVYVYDITSKESFANLVNWFDEVHKSILVSSYKGIIVGNKVDLDEFQVVDSGTAEEFAEAKNFRYVETSAKDGTGTSKLIDILAENVISQNSVQNDTYSPQKIVKRIGIVSEPSLTSYF
jgi:small GTP-binding protein